MYIRLSLQILTDTHCTASMSAVATDHRQGKAKSFSLTGCASQLAGILATRENHWILHGPQQLKKTNGFCINICVSPHMCLPTHMRLPTHICVSPHICASPHMSPLCFPTYVLPHICVSPHIRASTHILCVPPHTYVSHHTYRYVPPHTYMLPTHVSPLCVSPHICSSTENYGCLTHLSFTTLFFCVQTLKSNTITDEHTHQASTAVHNQRDR